MGAQICLVPLYLKLPHVEVLGVLGANDHAQSIGINGKLQMNGVVRPVIGDLLVDAGNTRLGRPDAVGGRPFVAHSRRKGLRIGNTYHTCLIASRNTPIIQRVVCQLGGQPGHGHGRVLARIDPIGVKDVVACRHFVSALGDHNAVSRLLDVTSGVVHDPREAQIVLIHAKRLGQKIDLQTGRLILARSGNIGRIIALVGRFSAAAQKQHAQCHRKTQQA